jgi:hypothetical protein
MKIETTLLALAASLCAVASAPAVAAPPKAQQVALSCSASADAMGCPSRATFAAIEAMRASAKRTPATALPKQLATRESSDGSRFQYDSCGCSN